MNELGRFTEPSIMILVSLAASDKHGYAMIEDIERITGERLGPGTLYGALARLEDQGLIEALPKQARRKPYRLTSKGRTALGAYLQGLENVSQVGLRRLGAGPA